MDEFYGTSSRDYLERARNCLDNGKKEALFYAAFELRCGIEQRMKEYLEVQKHISQKKRQGWQIAKLAKNIEHAFRLGDKKAILDVKDKQTGVILYKFVYTPVTSSLKKKGAQLGYVLHSSNKFHSAEDAYWSELRRNLEETYAELKIATSGTLLGPVLMHPNKKIMDMKVELSSSQSRIEWESLLGQELLLVVKYE